LTPYIAQIDLGGKGCGGGPYGYYRTLEEASRAKNALKIGDAVVVKTPYANLIGQYESETRPPRRWRGSIPRRFLPISSRVREFISGDDRRFSESASRRNAAARA